MMGLTHKHQKKLKKMALGFTLVELLVVIAIIGILATLALVSYTSAQRQARDTQRKSDVKQYQTALETYAAKNGGLYPVFTGNISDYCDEIELDSCPEDPVDGEYTYVTLDGGVTYTLTASLESKEADWVASSDGTASEQSSGGSSPTTDVPTATPTASAGVSPTTTATPTATATTCSGCYSGDGVCYSGLETTHCGRSGETCVNCSLQDRPDIGVYYSCNEAGRCYIPSVGEPL